MQVGEILRKKWGVVLLLVSVGLLFLGVSTVFGSVETRDMLYGAGDFEDNPADVDAFAITNAAATVGPVAGGANGTANALAMSVVKITSGGAAVADTVLVDYPFVSPEGLSQTDLSFYYKVDFSLTTDTTSTAIITAKIVKPDGTQVFAQPVDSRTGSLGWTSKTFANVAGLQANTSYVLRLEAAITSKVRNQIVKVTFDEIKLNMSWNDTTGPSFRSVVPGNNRYCQGSQAPLKVIITDPAGAKAVKWEYKRAGTSDVFQAIASNEPGTINGTVTKLEPYLGTDTFDTTWNTTGLATGDYLLRITAFDGAGDSSLHPTEYNSPSYITYKVDNEGPTVTAVTPAQNSVVSGYEQVLSASVNDWSKVGSVWWEYLDTMGTPDEADDEWVLIGQDNTPDAGDDSSGTFSTLWHTTNVKDGTYTLRVKTKDKSPAQVENSGYQVTYKVDNLRPRIENILPIERGYIRGNCVLSAKVAADYDGNGIDHVRWFYSGDGGVSWQLIGSDTIASNEEYAVTWDTTSVGEGTYDIKIEATNVLGKVGTALFKYTVDNTGPVLVSASASSSNLVTLLFTEANINSPSATDPANFQIYQTDTPANQLIISKIEPKADGSGLKLTTSNQLEGMPYTVAIVGGIYDNAGNPLTGGTGATFVGNGQAKGNPHGDYVGNTAWCAVCHVTHAGQAPKLMSKESEKLVCYICHDDSGLSYYDVKKEFGAVNAVGAATSHHPVPENEQMCITCHDPHANYGVANPMLLSVTDAQSNTYKVGNEVCWACHGSTIAHGDSVVPILGQTELDDKEVYYTSATGTDGGPMGVHANRDPVLFPTLVAPTYANINCDVCHVPHGSDNPKLLKLSINGNVVYGNSDDFCISCHTGQTSEGTSFLGKDVWYNTTYSAHSRTDSGALWPGGGYGVDRTNDTANRGKCINCHNVHGTPYGCGLVERFTIPAYNDTDAYGNYSICFRCHGDVGVAKGVTNKDMEQYYAETYVTGSNTYGGSQGHFIKSADRYKDEQGNNLTVGWKIPCTDCHNTHGSTGENRYLLKGSINGDDFTHLFKGTAKSGRQFCVQCHRYSDDGRGEAPYRGATIPLLPNTNPEHFSAGTLECNYCHGGGDLIKGAHAPNSGRSEGGLDCNLCHLTMAAEMGTNSTRYRHQMSHYEADMADKYDASSLGALESKTCLSTCHTDHDIFNGDPDGAKRYLRKTGGDTTVDPGPEAITNNYYVPSSPNLDDKSVAQVSALCMSSACHGTNGSLDDPNYASPSGFSGTSNLDLQVVTSTMSTHAISSEPLNSLYVNQNTLVDTPDANGYNFWADWNSRNPKRLVCTDCHVDYTTGDNFDLKRQGPHSSTKLYMLKATGNVVKGIQNYDALCNLCHKQEVYGGSGQYATNSTYYNYSNGASSHSASQHYSTTINPSGCLGCHAGNRDGYGSLGATRGSVHGTTAAEHFLNGNYINQVTISGTSGSCTTVTSDPSGARCTSKHTSPKAY